MSFSTRYLPHILYTIAITSISTHILNTRKDFEDIHAHTQTHISLLESLVQRLRIGEDVPENEFIRVERFGREGTGVDRAAARGVGVGVGVGEGGKEVIGWKEVLFGRKGGVGVGESEWEKRDLESVRKEIEDSGSSERS